MHKLFDARTLGLDTHPLRMRVLRANSSRKSLACRDLRRRVSVHTVIFACGVSMS